MRPIVATARALVVGGGMGGLAAAVELAAEGLDVTVLEAAPRVGGKVRTVATPAGPVDCGPTVFTLKPVFDALFAVGGRRLDDHIALRPVEILARHVWPDGSRLDLHTDPKAATDAIGRFAGSAEALRYLTFCRAAQRVYETLEQPYLHADGASLAGLIRRAGLAGLSDLIALRPFTSLWRALHDHFEDPRLRQLFARYATYCGSSPFAAPATLMLVAHVEQMGVHVVDGGIAAIVDATADLAVSLGARIVTDCAVSSIEVARGRISGVVTAAGDRLEADLVIHNGDIAALGSGLLGTHVVKAAPAMPRLSRSLSAVTFAAAARTSGVPLARHSVFFSDNYPAEFEALFQKRRLPEQPTVYVCAQDREAGHPVDGPERLLILVNAPADGDCQPLTAEEIARCQSATFSHLARLGLTLSPLAVTTTTPTDFARMFPATGGALYGRATHGWSSAFRRPGPRTPIPGLYLAGGSAHPGPGLPMATLSGQLAARAAIRDLASKDRSGRGGTPGGTSTE
ncbi:1-hydroxycarotenoid 3,4-desaturase CrtD [Mongoliimonas terrestris]|uniref:1-hydroxycarotenoid 3,4-desaturase CrtD n=1 Tax=Mongoliimonas terrestris TaxID=1709001 RepID=UPI000A961769|nr:1-hydroxycarotenoid 3,4-desaturase CrtD [Mongoliimonas terrestris]